MFTSFPSIVLLHNISTADHIAFEEKVMENLNGGFDGMELRDMNNDGRPDLIVGSGEVTYYPNTTMGSTISFGPFMYLANTSASSSMALAITDIDGDGKPDPINPSSYSGMSIFHNQSVPGDLSATDFPLTYFTNSGTYYDAYSVVTADFDGDNKPDIVENTFTTNQMIISRNIATPGTINEESLAVPVAFSNSSMQYYMNAADMDGDGKVDLVAASNSSVYYARNLSVTGNISLANPAPLITNVNSNNLAFITPSDIDGDGRMDILLIDGQNSKLSIYHNGPVVVPQITAISPLTAGADAKVTITGKHFDGTTMVNFGKKPAKSFTVVSTESIEAVVGDGETGDISIMTPNGPASFPGFIFAKAPVITAANVSADGSGKVIVTGSFFTKASAVVVGGVAATSFTVNSDTKITAVFTGAKGDLSVTTPGGIGTYSSISIKINEVISFPAMATHTYGDEDFTLTATSNNAGIPIVYSLDKPGVVTLAGNQLHIVAAGTVTITASQDGDALNNAAKIVLQQVTINKKTLTVKADDLVRRFGQANPTFSITYSGFVNGDDQASLITLPSVSSTAISNSPTGTYPIVVAGAVSGNYVFDYENGLLTISPPPDNFKVAANSVTCKGENNGSISITAAEPADYTAIITGNGLNKSYNFKTETSVGDLSPGTYNICITNSALVNYTQCFGLTITEPKDLSVYAITDKSSNKVTINLEGGSVYQIQLNGKSYTTNDNSITLPLNEGSNNLSVSTDKLCQGKVDQIINISGNFMPYPNPFVDILYINIGENTVNRAKVQIYDATTGTLQMEKEYGAQSGVLGLDVSNLGMGVYSIHLVIDSKEKVYKIFKR
jgi:hypothetical protein